MSNFNIVTEITDLSSLIETIKKDNLSIGEEVKKINEIIMKLDRSVWDTPNKQIIEEEFFPFVNNNAKYIPNILEECTNVLEVAKEKYKDNNLLLKNQTTKLKDFKEV